MSSPQIQREEAESLVARGREHHAAGNIADAISMLRRATDIYAVMAQHRRGDALVEERARACHLLADCLTEAGLAAEAANVYQEATDLYHQIGSQEAEQAAHVCAQSILSRVDDLRSRPNDRLYLLIAHHERRLRQLALEPESAMRQAECCMDIARIFQRRERYHEAAGWFEEALSRFTTAGSIAGAQLGMAECHHRLGLLTLQTGGSLPVAADHYRAAIQIYGKVEPKVHGEQSSLRLCQLQLEDLERMMTRQTGQPDHNSDGTAAE